MTDGEVRVQHAGPGSVTLIANECLHRRPSPCGLPRSLVGVAEDFSRRFTATQRGSMIVSDARSGLQRGDGGTPARWVRLLLYQGLSWEPNGEPIRAGVGRFPAALSGWLGGKYQLRRRQAPLSGTSGLVKPNSRLRRRVLHGLVRPCRLVKLGRAIRLRGLRKVAHSFPERFSLLNGSLTGNCHQLRKRLTIQRTQCHALMILQSSGTSDQPRPRRSAPSTSQVPSGIGKLAVRLLQLVTVV